MLLLQRRTAAAQHELAAAALAIAKLQHTTWRKVTDSGAGSGSSGGGGGGGGGGRGTTPAEVAKLLQYGQLQVRDGLTDVTDRNRNLVALAHSCQWRR